MQQRHPHLVYRVGKKELEQYVFEAIDFTPPLFSEIAFLFGRPGTRGLLQTAVPIDRAGYPLIRVVWLPSDLHT